MNQVFCRRMVRRLSDYIDGDIRPSLGRRIDSHLAGCKPCVAFLKTLRKTVQTLHAAGSREKIPPSLRAKLQRELARCAKSTYR